MGRAARRDAPGGRRAVRGPFTAYRADTVGPPGRNVPGRRKASRRENGLRRCPGTPRPPPLILARFQSRPNSVACHPSLSYRFPMRLRIDGCDVSPDLSAGSTFGAVLAWAGRKVASEGRVVSRIVADGQEIATRFERE